METADWDCELESINSDAFLNELRSMLLVSINDLTDHHTKQIQKFEGIFCNAM